MHWEEDNSDDDRLLSEELDQAEKQLGGGMSHADIFNFTPCTNRRARRFGVHQRTLTTRVSQPSQWTGGNIAQRLENALRHGVLRQVLNREEDKKDFLIVNMS